MVPKQALVRKGVLPVVNPAQTDVDELMELVAVHDLCLLNTWKSSKKSVAGTYSGHDVCAQIDFLATKRTAADLWSRKAAPLDLDWFPGDMVQSTGQCMVVFPLEETGSRDGVDPLTQSFMTRQHLKPHLQQEVMLPESFRSGLSRGLVFFRCKQIQER